MIVNNPVKYFKKTGNPNEILFIRNGMDGNIGLGKILFDIDLEVDSDYLNYVSTKWNLEDNYIDIILDELRLDGLTDVCIEIEKMIELKQFLSKFNIKHKDKFLKHYDGNVLYRIIFDLKDIQKYIN